MLSTWAIWLWLETITILDLRSMISLGVSRKTEWKLSDYICLNISLFKYKFPFRVFQVQPTIRYLIFSYIGYYVLVDTMLLSKLTENLSCPTELFSILLRKYLIYLDVKILYFLCLFFIWIFVSVKSLLHFINEYIRKNKYVVDWFRHLAFSIYSQFWPLRLRTLFFLPFKIQRERC